MRVEMIINTYIIDRLYINNKECNRINTILVHEYNTINNGTTLRKHGIRRMMHIMIGRVSLFISFHNFQNNLKWIFYFQGFNSKPSDQCRTGPQHQMKKIQIRKRFMGIFLNDRYCNVQYCTSTIIDKRIKMNFEKSKMSLYTLILLQLPKLIWVKG